MAELPSGRASPGRVQALPSAPLSPRGSLCGWRPGGKGMGSRTPGPAPHAHPGGIRALVPLPGGGGPQAGSLDTPPGGIVPCMCALGQTPRPRGSPLPQVHGRRAGLPRAAPTQQFDSSLPRMVTKAARGRGDRGGLGTGRGQGRRGAVECGGHRHQPRGPREIRILVLLPPLPSCVSSASHSTSLSLFPALYVRGNDTSFPGMS